jgi:hypothetical protein
VYELIPLASGVAVGLAATRFSGTLAAGTLIAAVALLAGTVASVGSGEIEESWAFLLWDTFQAVAAAVLTVVVARKVVASRRSP